MSLEPPALISVESGGPRVLVTGATGFLGRALVARLTADGHRVQALVRSRPDNLARVEQVRACGAEVCHGDVADPASFGAAMAGCETVVHLAAGTSGSVADSEAATRQGTKHLLELCRQHRPRRLVYVSTCNVYGLADYVEGSRVFESSPLERFPERRGAYTASKLEAESWVRDFMAAGTTPTVVLRPGTIYGPGGPLFTPLLGFAAGPVRAVIGDGSLVLPFVYVSNLVDAVMLALTKGEAPGHVFNVVDPEPITKRAYIDAVIRRVTPRARVVYVPYALLDLATGVQEHLCRIVGRPPVLTRYRLASSQRSVVYDTSNIERVLGWRQAVSAAHAMTRIVDFETARPGFR